MNALLNGRGATTSGQVILESDSLLRIDRSRRLLLSLPRDVLFHLSLVLSADLGTGAPNRCSVVLIVSTMFFVLIERPCMRKDWPSRFVAAFRADSLARTRERIPQRVRSIWGA